MVQQATQLVSHQEKEARSAVERIGANPENPGRRKTQLTLPSTLHFRDAECR